MLPYTVEPGDTLGQIAHKFSVHTEALAQASGLDDPNHIRVGAVLQVPLPAKEHVVVAGETLRDIALQEKVDLGSLVDFNQIDDPSLIHPGQAVLLPVPNMPQAATAPSTPDPGGVQVAAAASPTPSPAHASAPASPTPAPKPKPPAVIAMPPSGAPTDGLAGAALKLLGSAYMWGGSSPSGFDCSGFVWYVVRQVGKPISRGMLGEYNSGPHPSRDELKPGDLVFFQNTYTAGLSHNGIYIGNGQFVSAVDEALGVTVSSLNSNYWSSRWFGATRLP